MTDNQNDTQKKRFEDLGLSDPLLKAIHEAGYEYPTPIQEKAIPAIFMNRDVLASAQTGTGKTASFTLPMLDILSDGRAKARMPRSVILTPTRELATQISENFTTYGKYQSLSMALLIGGVAFGEQQKKLTRGVDVLIATPGRLIDQMERGHLLLHDVKIFIIDEADRMLDMGFIPDVERIIEATPENRQTLMFSATMPKEIKKLADRFLVNPKEITVATPSSAGVNIDQALIHLSDKRKKIPTMITLLKDEEIQSALIFCNRKRDVADLATRLKKEGFNIDALHGDMDQHSRTACLERFKAGEVSMLVCSDVAARGLDIPLVSHVFNYDLPFHAEDYVHRIGRTGRAGRSGIARSLYTNLDEKECAAIEEMLKKPIPKITMTGVSKTTKNSASQVKENQPKATKEKATKEKPVAKPKAKPDNKASSETVSKAKNNSEDSEKDDNISSFGSGNDIPDFLR